MLKKDFKDFKKFWDTFEFKGNTLQQKGNEIFFKDECVVTESGETVAEGKHFINVGYKLKNPYSKLLSNLFPYQFKFLGKKVSSIEAVLQGLKFKNKKTQNLVLKYSGTDANNIKFANDYDWQKTKILFWQGKPMHRLSQEFQEFILKLYVSAIQNPLYRNALKNTNKTVIHSIGEDDPNKTVLSRFEFEKILSALSNFLANQNKND